MSKSIKLKGGQAVVQALKKEKTRHVFGLIGSATMEIFDALYHEKDIKFIGVRDERTGAHMADGYARVSNRPGVILAGQNGPGATNLVTGVAQAAAAFSPVVSIAGFISTKDKLKRNLPGRLIGVSKDSHGNPALRLALQTREQHIRRDRATSNICTAQVLLAIMSSMYAIYHGPDKLKQIASRINFFTRVIGESLKNSGFELYSDNYFDTIRVKCDSTKISDLALKEGYNFWKYSDSVGISLDETVQLVDVKAILNIFKSSEVEPLTESIPEDLRRTDSYLTHPVFNSYHSETEMLRYIHRLENKDLSLNFSMIPLGSCTMKLNSVTEMEAVTWPEFSNLHPYAPEDQARGYYELFKDLENWLCDITGFSEISLQPNAGSQGEYAGMLAIRDFHLDKGNSHRNICLIPTSAHGTNPASAVMVGMKVVGISCDEEGNIDLADFKSKIDQYSH